MAYQDFLNWIDQWFETLPSVSLGSLLKEFPEEQTALISVDVLNGFCKEGNLASDRVAGIVPPVVRLFRRAEQEGLQHYVLLQDNHPSDSKEFLVYPPHCIEESHESRTVQELIDLPHSYKFEMIPKRTINPGLEPRFQKWLEDHDSIKQFLVVGDCTDICVYLLSLFLKTWAIERNVAGQIVVPVDCVNTFDIPLQKATEEVLPHPGELIHRFFLYHMQTNGIRIVSSIE